MSTQEIVELQLKIAGLNKQIGEVESQAKKAEENYYGLPEFPVSHVIMRTKNCYGTLMLIMWEHHKLLIKKKATYEDTMMMLEKEYQIENSIAEMQEDLRFLTEHRC